MCTPLERQAQKGPPERKTPRYGGGVREPKTAPKSVNQKGGRVSGSNPQFEPEPPPLFGSHFSWFSTVCLGWSGPTAYALSAIMWMLSYLLRTAACRNHPSRNRPSRNTPSYNRPSCVQCCGLGGGSLKHLHRDHPSSRRSPETDPPKEDPSMFYAVAPRTPQQLRGHPLSILVPLPPPSLIISQ
jgi:hypothetical protein